MWIERDHNTGEVTANLVEGLNDMTVAEMHPIEISEGHHTALEA
jgi:hypothetical protein